MSWSPSAAQKHIASVQSRLRTEAERKQLSLSFAKLCMKTKLYADASKYLLSYLQLKPTDSRAYKLLGESYEKQEEWGRAIAAYTKSLDFWRNQKDVIVKVGELYCQMPDAPVEAKKEWAQRMEKVAPRHVALLKLKATIAAVDKTVPATEVMLCPSEDPEEHIAVAEKFASAGEIVQAHMYCQKVREEGLFLKHPKWNRLSLDIHQEYLDLLREEWSSPKHMAHEVCLFLKAHSLIFELEAKTAHVGWNQKQLASELRKYDHLLSCALKYHSLDTTLGRAVNDAALKELRGKFFAMSAQMMLLYSGGPKHPSHQLAVACLLASLDILPPEVPPGIFGEAAREVEGWRPLSMVRMCIVVLQLRLVLSYYSAKGVQACVDRYGSQEGMTQALKLLLIESLPPGSPPSFNPSMSFLANDMTLEKISHLPLPDKHVVDIANTAFVRHFFEHFGENLPALVWFALACFSVGDKASLCEWLPYCFPSLPISTPLATFKRADPDTLCLRDIEAFFLLAVEEYIESISAFQDRDRADRIFHHLLTEVPCWEKISLLEHLCTSWDNFHIFCQKKNMSVVDMFIVKKNISVALRSVRALSSQLPISKLVLLARHFKDQAEECAKSDDGASPSQRAQNKELLLHSCYYWQAVLDRVAPKPSARPSSTPDPRKYASPKKFSYLSSVKWSPHVPNPAKRENISEEVEREALMTLGHAALMRSNCEQAISLYAKVATPAAAWNQSQIYRFLAGREDGEEIRLTLLLNAADCIELAMSRTSRHDQVLLQKLRREEQEIYRMIEGMGYDPSSFLGTSDMSPESSQERLDTEQRRSHHMIGRYDSCSFFDTSAMARKSAEQPERQRLMGGHDSGSSLGTSAMAPKTSVSHTRHTPATRKHHTGFDNSAVKERDVKLASVENRLQHLEDQLMVIHRMQRSPASAPSHSSTTHSLGKTLPQSLLSPPKHDVPVLTYSPSPKGVSMVTTSSGAPRPSIQPLFSPVSTQLGSGRGVPTQQPSAIKGSVVEWGGPLNPAPPPASSQPPQPRAPLVPMLGGSLISSSPLFSASTSMSSVAALKQPVGYQPVPSTMSSISSQASFVFAPGQVMAPLSSLGQPSQVSSTPATSAPPPRLFQFGQIDSLGVVGKSPFQFSSPSPPPAKAPAMTGPSVAKQPTSSGPPPPTTTKQPSASYYPDAYRFSAPLASSQGSDTQKSPASAFQHVGVSPFSSITTVSSTLTYGTNSGFTPAVKLSSSASTTVGAVLSSDPLPSSFSFSIPTSEVPLASSSLFHQPLISTSAGRHLQPAPQVGSAPSLFTSTGSSAPTVLTSPLTHLRSTAGSVPLVHSVAATGSTNVLTKMSTGVSVSSLGVVSTASSLFPQPATMPSTQLHSTLGNTLPFQSTASSSLTAAVTTISASSFGLGATSSSFFVPPATSLSHSNTSADASPFSSSYGFPISATPFVRFASFPPVAVTMGGPMSAADDKAGVPKLTPSFNFSSPGNSALLSFSTPLSRPPLLPDPVKEVPSASQDSDEADDTSFNTSAEFTPVVTLPEVVDLKSGEEEDNVIFAHKAKLFRYENSGKQWKERGVGTIKVLQHTQSGKFRVLMRRDQILKICCNHYITSDMVLKPYGSEGRAWVWFTPSDFADEVTKPENFVVRFKQSDTAKAFRQAFLKATGMETSLTEQLEDAEPATSTTPLVSNDGSSLKQNTSEVPSGGTTKLLSKSIQSTTSWSCDTCWLSNKEDDLVCPACNSPKPGKEHTNGQSLALAPSSIATKPQIPVVSVSGGVKTDLLEGASLSFGAHSSAQQLGGTLVSSSTTGGMKLSLLQGTSLSALAETPRLVTTPPISGGVALPQNVSLSALAGASGVAHKPAGAPASGSIMSQETRMLSQIAVPCPASADTSTEEPLVCGKLSSTPGVFVQPPFHRSLEDEAEKEETSEDDQEESEDDQEETEDDQEVSEDDQEESEDVQEESADDVDPSVSGKLSSTLSIVVQPQFHSSLGDEAEKEERNEHDQEKSEDDQEESEDLQEVSEDDQKEMADDVDPLVSEKLSSTPSIVVRPLFHSSLEDEVEKEERSEHDQEKTEDDREESADMNGLSASAADRSVGYREEEDDSDVEIVEVTLPPQDLVRKAEEFLLPAGFYLYETKTPCPGCRGCDDQLEGPHWSEMSTPTTQLATSVPADHTTTFLTSQVAGTSSVPGLFASHIQSSTLSFGDLASQPSDTAWQLTDPDEKGFSFSAKPLFSTPVGEESNQEEETGGHFEPRVTLPKLDKIETGEEDEDVLFCQRAKLFRFDSKTNQWKERGVGEIKVLVSKTSGNGRLIMRREQILKLCCNHVLSPELSILPQGATDKCWMWFTPCDFSEDEQRPEKFVAKFKNKEIAMDFKMAFCRGCGHEVDTTENGDDSKNADISNENQE